MEDTSCWNCVNMLECICCDNLLCTKGVKLPEEDSSICKYFLSSEKVYVFLVYFDKRTYEFYGNEKYSTTHTELQKIWEEVKFKLNNKELPNVPADKDIIILVNIPNIKENKPKIIF